MVNATFTDTNVHFDQNYNHRSEYDQRLRGALVHLQHQDDARQKHAVIEVCHGHQKTVC